MEAFVAAALEILGDDVVKGSNGKRTAERCRTFIDAAKLTERVLHGWPGDPIL